ncbi:helix-turn-helix domain-containing protein [Neobacillus jeddahensis]|uniref:helix-turn-helix domain-containing protein n=1 Tax=Neobacillus jeddahensis TaxID=1461580 RepID=UPI0005AB0A38|nr:helix-turn-helix transcriptional regulator [Neobacillus jeddahensis]
MPLENNLRIIMAQKRIDNITELISITGLSRNALNKLWHNKELESAKLGTLMVICDKLDIPLSSLVEYIPEEKK